jgi:hypothetical protein
MARRGHSVVDILSLAVTHGLMAIALWRLLSRDDLGRDPGEAALPARPWLRAPVAEPDDEA